MKNYEQLTTRRARLRDFTARLRRATTLAQDLHGDDKLAQAVTIAEEMDITLDAARALVGHEMAEDNYLKAVSES